MKKLLATILMVAACGTASAAELNLSAQQGMITDSVRGDTLAGVQLSVDDIYEGVGLYGSVGKIHGDSVPKDINSNKRYRSIGVTYKATDNVTVYTGFSQARYSGKSETYYVHQVVEGRKMKLKAHRAVHDDKNGIEVGMRYTMDNGLAFGMGYNTAPKAVFTTIGWTFK
ncbi:Lom outer membrane protein [Vibrio phage Thalassa]|uniref:Uncharacterized protein n=1 Tax=Vibrio phage Thalassa TaxID=2570301 RepID=A0A2H5BH97_9CAUD|nr:Lom outer membrane protein [Vibrio phage Thalassa]AUG85366.1 hypothetical protein THALASSA_187 [Vibrio phage Thalassa]